MKIFSLYTILTFFFFAVFQQSTYAQVSNDSCTTAMVIPDVYSDQAFVCVESTTLNALPESYGNNCFINDFPTVWFLVQTDGNAALMNIQVTTDDFESPTISLFLGLPDCSDLQLVSLTQSNLPCVVGSNGEAEALGTDVGGSTNYYIAVSGINTAGGDIEVCVNTISPASICVIDRNIEITSRSSGGPLEGPFFPGETVGICMNVNSFSAAGNGCQWFQGLVPVFGNGWDPASFHSNGQPLDATINGNPMGVPGNGIYGTSHWDWFTDVDYHFDNPYHQLGDFDGNGTLDICSLLYDPDCPNTGGLNGGCCAPCWGAPLGTILPPGWFAYGINGSCPTPGPPIRVDWGDGNTCGAGMGPWNFCFELMVREYPQCLEDPSTSDLALGFFTFADGETGSWTGNASVCALDQPAKITLPMCCTEIAEYSEEISLCSGGSFSFTLDDPQVEYWEWTVDEGSAQGASEGEGAGVIIINDTLTLTGQQPEVVEYIALGFLGLCPVVEQQISVTVYPGVYVDLDPLEFCGIPPGPITLEAQVSGGTGNYEYQWSPGGETTQSIIITTFVDSTEYIVNVIDESGCVDSDTTVLNFVESFPVEIIAPVTEQCIQDGPILIEASALGGNDPFNYEWYLPDGSISSGEELSAYLPGTYIINVTDDVGCVGSDTITLTFNETPSVVLEAQGNATIFCAGDSMILIATATSGEAPYTYTWDTPQGLLSGPTIVAYTPGTYSVVVEDTNGCNSDSSNTNITEAPLPVINLGPDTIIVADATTLDAGPGWITYAWNTGETTQIITVDTSGSYVACVTDTIGCMACDTIYVDIITNTIYLNNNGYLNISPNPSKGIFMLTGELPSEEKMSIHIFNSVGQVVYTSPQMLVINHISKEINLDSSPPGVYYVQISVGLHKHVRKIVVE